jgi:Xaa-Pro aminopeptidase
VSGGAAAATLAARIIAGIPARSAALYREIRFSVGDPAALVVLPGRGEPIAERLLIIRDIEMDRARKGARADRVACPADFAPSGGLSGDRETATAQSVAECVRRAGLGRAVLDRSTPAIYWHELARAGIAVACDPSMGVFERRSKDAQEIAWLREAQSQTEAAMRMACELVARASAAADGTLMHAGETLTSERVRAAIDRFLLDRGYSNPESIVAGGPVGAHCHDHGHGALRTGEPVIIDIFPLSRATLYSGDCTRTVVHGTPHPEVVRMHAAVVAAKAAAIAAIGPGVTGEAVHAATSAVMRERGFAMGLPPAGAPDSWCGMTHGTGHGIGLDVHEPPLLAAGGPELVVGDVLTVEPGLYSRAHGGIRVEDMVVVTATGCDNLNSLPEGLDWR